PCLYGHAARREAGHLAAAPRRSQFRCGGEGRGAGKRLAAVLRRHPRPQPPLPLPLRRLTQRLQQGLLVLSGAGEDLGHRQDGLRAHTTRTLEASVNSLAKSEMEVMAARSSWRSMSLSYSTVTSLPQICSRA